MRDTMGIIVANDEKIAPLTDKRAVIALPIAGSYRIIDFALSNMANAGITNVGIVTDSNYSSLMDHLKSGNPWDLDRKKHGLKILPPNLATFDYGRKRGDLDMLAGIKDYLKHSPQTYVILSLSNIIYNIDFDDVLEKHLENQADITIIYKDMTGTLESELSRFTLIELDEDNQVTDIELKPQYPKSAYASLDLFVMEKALLESIIDECTSRGDHDFIKDAISKKIHGLIVNGYKFDGYFDKIDSLKSYFENNAAFLDEKHRNELFNPENPIYTKNKDLPSAIYRENAQCENSFISNGCIIEGTVKNSILSRGVVVQKGAVVKNSIIMQDSVIGENATLDHVIFDKDVKMLEGKRLIGQKNYPVAVGKSTKI